METGVDLTIDVDLTLTKVAMAGTSGLELRWSENTDHRNGRRSSRRWVASHQATCRPATNRKAAIREVIECVGSPNWS